MGNTLPSGFSFIPAGLFQGAGIASFGFKQTPVTNQEYGEVGRDRFVLLKHHWKTGETVLMRSGSAIPRVAYGPALAGKIDFDQGDMIILGSAIFLKMVTNPSVRYDEAEVRFRSSMIFSGAKQPAVGVTYFHAKAWCLLKTSESRGKFVYDLPTPVQYRYVATDRGTKEYGTETGTLFKEHKKLVHIKDAEKGLGSTVAVDDPRYEQDLPFGVQTTGNVRLWIRFNSKYKLRGDYFLRPDCRGPYGNYGISWRESRPSPEAWHSGWPTTPYDDVGFSPVSFSRKFT